MLNTPRGMRLHIGIFGRRNVGKSSLLNAMTGQDVSIVSPTPGTTTDVVGKPMELKPLGPVFFLDTAGLDDAGELGRKRIARSHTALDQTDLALVVVNENFGEYEQNILNMCKQRKIPGIVVFNKCDILKPPAEHWQQAGALASAAVQVSALTGMGLDALRRAMVDSAPKDYIEQPTILADLAGPGSMVLMVVPIDLEAPKGRLILPQVQMIREVLDSDGYALVVKERELLECLNNLKKKPELVITDSQAILKVVGDVPVEVPLTSFSVLFARWKGDLEIFVQGVSMLDKLEDGAKILMLEACTHHPIGDDIGKIKIPRWLRHYSGKKLEFEHFSGHDLPQDISQYQLIIHCGGCMLNRREVLNRILAARAAGIPITNYGLVIAKSLGVLKRILSPFPALADKYK